MTISRLQALLLALILALVGVAVSRAQDAKSPIVEQLSADSALSALTGDGGLHR